METSTVQSIKLAIISATDLSKDALHIYAGLALLLGACGLFKKPLSSVACWLIVLIFACTNELFDMRDDITSLGYWRWQASLHDVVNTLFWPTALSLLHSFNVLGRNPT